MIGVISTLTRKECNVEELSTPIRSAWDSAVCHLATAGHEVVELSVPSLPLSVPVYYIIAQAEASSNLARYDGVRYGSMGRQNGVSDAAPGRQEQPSIDCVGVQAFHDMVTRSRTSGFGLEVKRRILTGSFVLSSSSYKSYYEKAQVLRRMISMEFDDALVRIHSLL